MSARPVDDAATLHVTMARRFHQRLIGWMGRRHFPVDEALLLRPCRSVHGCFMRRPIDVVFLDARGKVLRVAPLLPWKALRCRGAHMALEMAHGAFARWGHEAVQHAVLAACESGQRAPRLATEER